ncbi:MAG: GNAT family protein [Phycisphaerales bacterium]
MPTPRKKPIDRALLKGKAVYIRHPVKRDEAQWCALWEESWEHLKPWYPRPASAHTGAASTRFGLLMKSYDTPTNQQHLVCRRSDDSIVGMVNLGQIFHGPFRSCYIGYWVGERFAGKGYTSAAVRLVLRRAFGELKLHRVEANVIPDNGPSIALAESVGFRREGYSPRYLKIAGKWQDHVRFAMTVEDWREMRKRS